MKRKETFWELLERLDEQAGEFNIHLSEANKYFDTAATKTRELLAREEKDLHETIAKVKKAIKKFSSEKDNANKPENEKTGS
jgi:flagellar hook-basal body complex protein FliE